MCSLERVERNGGNRWAVGTQLLAKVRGWKCHWPAVVWNLRLCLLKDMNQLLESYKEGALQTPCPKSAIPHTLHILRSGPSFPCASSTGLSSSKHAQ